MSRELLNQLIEKVREIPTRPGNIGGQNYKYVRLEEVIGLLLDALDSYEAKPLPNPVAWMKKHENGVVIFSLNPAEESDFTPLYAEPSEINPMPDVEISKAFCDETGVSIGDTIEDAFEAGVRFGEQYHGIKEQE